MKKKSFLVLLISLLATIYAFGQDSLATQPLVEFRGTTMVSVFGGGYTAQENSNNNGEWYGVYLEHTPIRFLFSEYKHLNLGLSVLASKSSYDGNDKTNKYSSTNYEFGAGIAGGFYSYHFSKNSALYLGANSLIKECQETGEGSNSSSTGRYLSKEKYLVWSSEVSFNVLKTYEAGLRTLPRIQLRLTYQRPFNCKRDAFWNTTPLPETNIWDKTAYMSELKMSIYRFGKNSFFEPKVVAAYHYYEGDKSKWAILGVELSLRKMNWDDFFSLSFSVKKQVGNYLPNLNSTQFTLGINFMPFNFKR